MGHGFRANFTLADYDAFNTASILFMSVGGDGQMIGLYNLSNTSTGERHHRASEKQTRVQNALQVLAQRLSQSERESLNVEGLIRELDRGRLTDFREALLTLLQALPTQDSPPEQAPAQLCIFCFGSFRVSFCNRPISMRRTGKGTAILKYLAAKDQPVLRDVLLEAIWPETEPEVSNNRLRVAVHHLRQIFESILPGDQGGNLITFSEGGYVLNTDLNVWTDVRAFELNWETGRWLESVGRAAEAVPYYLEAKALYRGDFLEHDLLEEWTLARREGLKDTYLKILDRLSRYWLKNGSVDHAIEGWKDIIRRDPWREDAYRMLMESYARSGQRALALRCYETCKQTLAAELEVEPDPETTALYDRIRAGETTGA